MFRTEGRNLIDNSSLELKSLPCVNIHKQINSRGIAREYNCNYIF